MPKRNRGIQTKYRKDRQCWELIEYIGGKRKRHATGFSSREEAEEKLAEILVSRQKPYRDTNISIGKVMAYYINEHVPSIAAPETALLHFDRLIPFWAEIKLFDMKKSLCFDYIEYRKSEYKKWRKSKGYEVNRPLSNSTVRRELETLQASIRYAYKDNLTDICPYVWKPERSKNRDRWLTKIEAASLLRATRKLPVAGYYLRTFILLGLYTGARTEDMLSLQWRDIDLDTGIIDFSRYVRSKYKKGAVIPIPRRLHRELKVLKRCDIGYVVNNNGKRIGSVKKSFKRCCEIAGLEDVTPHTLRHTAASWQVQNNVPLYKVAKYLGHSSTRMVEQTYGHMSSEYLKEVVESYG